MADHGASLTGCSGDVLEVIAQYLCHAEKYKDVKDPPILDVPLDVVLDVLLAAEYLDRTCAL